MSFGQKILEKYGFKEGDGLGKNGSGIKTAIKANFKVIRKLVWKKPIYSKSDFSSIMLVSAIKDPLEKTTGGNVSSTRLPVMSMFKNRKVDESKLN